MPALPFAIIHESPDLLVIEKPPGMLVHPTKPDGPPTLFHHLCQLLAFERTNGGSISIINRLDRETSGLVLIAKTAGTTRQLGLWTQQRAIRKEYRAIVWGWPPWEEFDARFPIARLGTIGPSTIHLKRGVHPSGSPCHTRFRLLQRFTRATANGERFSLVAATLFTGRTHQIRVHLAKLGHPVVGDKIYGPSDSLYLEFIRTGWTPELERALLLPRHALHCSRMALPGDAVFESALPSDLASWLPLPASQP